MRRILLGLVLMIAACGASLDSQDGGVAKIEQAVTSVYANPYSGSVVTAIVGKVGGDANSWLVFWRSSDSNCQWTELGTPTLPNPIDIDLQNAAGAEVQILGPGQTKSVYCSNFSQSWTFNLPVSQGTNSVGVEGSPGGDYINCTGDNGSHFNNLCNGKGGNDILESWSSNVALHGNEGNDKIKVHAVATTATSVFGDDGIDCLTFDSTPGIIRAYDCGTHPPGCVGTIATCDTSSWYMGTNCQWTAVPAGGNGANVCN